MASKNSSTPTPASRGPKTSQSTRQKLIDAAYNCFDRYGVPKTTMEDVALAAGYSRQTVYKHFPSKDDLINAIGLLESDKLYEAIRQRITQCARLPDKMTESILITLSVGQTNPYIRRLIEPEDVQTRSTQKNDPLHAAQLERWGPLLEEARANGELADDLDFDEIVGWLTLMQMSLLLKQEQFKLDTPQLERLIRRFIVAPVFSRPAYLNAQP